MEHPQPETQRNAQTKVHEPQPKSDLNDSARVPNVDENAAGLVKASGSQGPTEQSMECTDSPRGSIKKSVHWNPELFTESTFVASPNESPRYFSSSSSSLSSPSFSVKDTVDTVRTVLGIWRRKVGEATRKAENLAENTWQHLKTNPSLSEAALGRIARQTKVLAEGGYEKIFQNTFETVPEEQLQKAYACYVSTSVGPVMGILYISTAKIAYCSDNPLSYIVDDQTEWSYYKVVIPLHELKEVNPSSSRVNPAEKYIQLISVDNSEFWLMGFLNYEGAVDCLLEAFQANKLRSEQ